MNQPRDARGRFLKNGEIGEQKTKVITGLKGFDKDFRCMGMQYEPGKSFHIGGRIRVCDTGMHFCTTPLNAFNFYSPELNRFALVEASGSFSFSEEAKMPYLGRTTKVAASDLLVKKELALDELVDTLVASASGLKIQNRKNYNVCALFEQRIKYRPIQVSHRIATNANDEQDILLVNGVAINTDTEGYAGSLPGFTNAGITLSVTCKSRSIAYGQHSITLAENSVAKGWTALSIGSRSIAYGKNIAVASGGWSVAIVSEAGSVAVCSNHSKVILYGSESVGVVGRRSGAEVYNNRCVLLFMELPDRGADEDFILRDGTHLILRYAGKMIDVVAGTDVKTTKTRGNVPVYSATQIHTAFISKYHDKGRKS